MDKTKLVEVRQCLLKSQRDLKAAKVLLANEEALLDAVVYHCHQSAEKALKAYLVYQNVPFRKEKLATLMFYWNFAHCLGQISRPWMRSQIL